MRKVLVTGGAGFIGSNLCEALLERGDWVVCLDNFSTGHMENLIPLISRYPDSFRLIVGDIRNFDDCLRAVEGVDYVLHEAALGSVPRSVKDPVTTNEVNIGGFLNMIVASRDAKVKRFIFAASSSTYGDSKSLPKVGCHRKAALPICYHQIRGRTLRRCFCPHLRKVRIYRSALFQCIWPAPRPEWSLCGSHTSLRKKTAESRSSQYQRRRRI